MGSPFISVVTVCLNSEKHLERTIRSIINQGYELLEYIIVDGGSVDGTLDIIREFSSYITCWISEPDRGIYDAMNKAIGFAKGDLIGFINSDDWYVSGALRVICEAWERNPQADVIYGDLINVHKNGSSERLVSCHEDLLERYEMHHPSWFVRRTLHAQEKFDQSYGLSADFELISRLYFLNKTFVHVDKPIAHFCTTGVSQIPSFRQVSNRFSIRKKYDTQIALKMAAKELPEYAHDVFYFYMKRPVVTRTAHRWPLLYRIFNFAKKWALLWRRTN